MTTVAIIQARTGSTRLPRKVLEDIGGEPMLARVVERAGRAARVHQVVVATSTAPGDDAIVALAETRGWHVHRGSEDDVLDCFQGAASTLPCDRIVRITADCPLLDPAVVDRVLEELDKGFDYASNTLEPRTFPRGLDVEAMTAETLDRAFREDRDPRWREHVTPYIYRHPELFRLGRVAHEEDLSALRWTVDTAADLELVRRIYAAVPPEAGLAEVLAVVRAHPEWSALNADVHQKVVPG